MDFRLCLAWGIRFGWHEAICTSEVHCTAAEIRSPIAFGGIIEEIKYDSLLGRLYEVEEHGQAWHGRSFDSEG